MSLGCLQGLWHLNCSWLMMLVMMNRRHMLLLLRMRLMLLLRLWLLVEWLCWIERRRNTDKANLAIGR